MTGPAGPPRAADSSGVPWAGRTLTAQPFAGDDGSIPAALGAALAAGDPTAVVTALAGCRVFVPVVAVLGEGEEAVAAEGDKSADMALITLTGRDGSRALPVFASTASLAAWDPAARPVPVEATRAALSAVAEGCDVMVLDPSGPMTFVVPRPAVWAVAQGRAWRPPAADDVVRAEVARVVEGVPQVVAHRCDDDGLATLTVTLGLPPGLPEPEVRRITAAVSAGLTNADTLTERVGQVKLALREAGPRA